MTKKSQKRTTDFKQKSDLWYNPEYDRDLIEQSIAKQYHILPSKQGELSYSDWTSLVSGLMEDTPLGQIVLIRKEDDRERINNFSPYERRIYNEWRDFIAKRKREDVKNTTLAIKNLEEMFRNMFG